MEWRLWYPWRSKYWLTPAIYLIEELVSLTVEGVWTLTPAGFGVEALGPWTSGRL